MLYKSFGIVRTNVGLTTNVKLIVDSKYKLYLDSIDSNNDLSLSRFKKFAVNKKDRYDRLIPNFYKNFPSDLAFDIKYDNDVDSMKNNFRFQHDETYQYGARNIINNKSYSEEFEYFAPIYIFPDNLPNSFIIFRVDGTGLDVINKDNFQSNIVKKFKTVKRFDLTKQTPIGEWLDINYTKNESFPISPLDIDFKRNEFSKWNGIDYSTGGYTSKSLFLEEWFSEEKEIFETEKFIFDGYKNNKIVFPNILNLSFLFDDTPSTPDKKRKWSINRYYGFYFDSVEHITSVFPTKTKQLKQNVSIDQNNLLISESGYPFLDAWNDSINNYIEILGTFYKVVRLKNTKKPELPSDIIDDLQDDVVIIDLNNKTERTNINSAFIEEFLDDTVYSYKIISDKPLSSFINDVNKNTGFTIDSDNILRINGSTYSISGFDDADIWLIEINNILHNLVKESETIKVFTDYSFNFDPTSNSYSYKVGGLETKINLIKNNQQEPEEFKIYRLKFTDLKDFDTRIVDTEPSKFEYELENKLTETDESKMYLTDLNSDTNPKEIDTFIIDEKLVNIPVSSEYTANYETFKITESGLTELWRKNSTYCRFGFQKSLSANDFPYVLNNSLLFEDFNRTTNVFEPSPKRIERNLDYFYTINSDSSDYVHHSLHVEKNLPNFSLDKNFRFEIEKYLDPNGYDYFSEFFNRRSSFLNGSIIKNTIKYSYFNKGDKSIPNITLFRGIKFLIYDVEDIKKNLNNQLDVINLKTSNSFQDYKFSILLSDNKEYDSIQRIVDYSTTSCEVPTVYYLTSGLTYSYSDSYTVENRRYYIDGDGSNKDVLIGKYILLSDDMVSPNIATPSYHETDNCKHKVLYKIDNYGYDSDVDSFYINLVDSEDNKITDPNYLPNSLGTFSFISSLNDYPYMMIGTNSGIYLGNTFSIGTYSVSVTESGYFEEDQYIKITDSNNNDINVIYGNGVTGSIYIDTLVSENDMNWKIIENWEMDKTYPPNSYVLYDDVIYRSLESITTTQPTIGDKKSTPYNIDGWKNETVFGSPFLDFEKNYDLNDFVFNSGDYYKKIYVGEDINGDFWNPTKYYNKNNIVLYKGKYYESLVDNNKGYSPFEKNWKEIDSKDLMWSKIQLWNPSKSYLSGSLVIHNEIVYLSNQTIDSNEEPGFSDKWVRKYSLVADSDIQYEPNNNPIIWFNNKYYLILSNTTDSNLENGIKIYVNKKWKNILINIEIKDNTTPNLKNVNRDELYIDLNKKLTASNFINSLNDISNRYDFIDYLKYIIIDENGEKLEYDYNNIEGLPCLINCEFPDDLSVKVDSLNVETIDLKNDLIPKQVLKDNVLGNSNQINYYNGNPIAVRIIENKNEPKTFSNYNSNDNIVANLLYRFSGFYMPIFYDVNMFYKGKQKTLDNYKFTTTCIPPVIFSGGYIFKNEDDLITTCPDGFILTPDGKTCEKLSYEDITINEFTQAINGGKRDVYGRSGLRIIDLKNENLEFPIKNSNLITTANTLELIDQNGVLPTILVSSVTNNLWGNNSIISGRLNNVGIRPNVADIQLNATIENPKWYGFSACVEISNSGVYTIAMAANNFFRFKLNNKEIIKVITPNGDTFKRWWGFEIELKAGKNIIEISYSEDGNVANSAFACEIYSTDSTVLSSLSTESELEPYIIFTTKNQSVIHITPISSGYSCPTGYNVDLCSVEPTCVKIEKVDSITETISPLYRYRTTYNILPYINWYVISNSSSYSGNENSCQINILYKIFDVIFNESTNFYEFNITNPDGSETSDFLSMGNDLMLVENLNDNFGIFIDNINLEVEIGDLVYIVETECELPNPKPYYIKDIIEYSNGFLLDIYDSNNNRVSFEDQCEGIIKLPKSKYLDNYRFDTDLTYFGIMLEKKISKINRNGSVLKLKDKTNIRSIYPMLDEFGYDFTDFFIFKGTFDYNYYIETNR